MGRPTSNDIAHEQVTDHWIKRRGSSVRLPLATAGDLVSVGDARAGAVRVSDRDLGLAYAQLAVGGDKAAGLRAIELLHKAEKESAIFRDDHEAYAQLGFLEQLNGNATEAEAEYRATLAADPDDAIAASNLGLIEAENHHVSEAVKLWWEVFAHDPAETGAGFNLAVVQCGAGEPGESLQTLDRILQFSPDNDRARSMAVEIRSGKRACHSHDSGVGE